MFNHLVESSSHAREFKRRSSFVLFATTCYALLFVVAGVVSIYAYDARLEEPASEVFMVNPIEMETPKAESIGRVSASPSGGNNRGVFVRTNPTASVEETRLTLEAISATPNTNPPLPQGVTVKTDNFNSDPRAFGSGSSNGGGVGGSGNAGGNLRIEVEAPPPLPPEKPKQQVFRKNIINGEALFLPKPPYPPIAKLMGIQGTVSVQVLVDETGKVISAKAVSGNPVLMHPAQQAAMNARFSPTRIGEQAVKVSGVIVYNFVLQ